MNLVFEQIASMEAEDPDKNGSKAEKCNRNEENRRKVISFIADNKISDSNLYFKSHRTQAFKNSRLP